MLLSPPQSPSVGEEVRISQLPQSQNTQGFLYYGTFFPCLGVSEIPIYGDKVDNWE